MKEKSYGKCRACANPLKSERIHTGAWKSRKSAGFSTFPTGLTAFFLFLI
jgi:ribosomal protein L37AE/L43A